jgi:hypothetical protein
MAVPQTTALPTWYDVQKEVAQSQQEVMKTEEMKHEQDLRKSREADLEREARALYADEGKPTDTTMPKGYNIPSTDIMPSKDKPVGAQVQEKVMAAPGGTDFWKGEAPTEADKTAMAEGKDLMPGAPAEAATKDQVQGYKEAIEQPKNLGMQVRDGMKDLQFTNQQIALNQKLAKDAALRGDPYAQQVYADKASTLSNDLITKKENQLKLTDQVMETKGRLARGFKAAVKAGVDPSLAWGQMTLDAQLQGASGEELRGIDPRYYGAYADKMIAEAEKGSDYVKQQLENLKEDGRNKRSILVNEFKNKSLLLRTRAENYKENMGNRRESRLEAKQTFESLKNLNQQLIAQEKDASYRMVNSVDPADAAAASKEHDDLLDAIGKNETTLNALEKQTRYVDVKATEAKPTAEKTTEELPKEVIARLKEGEQTTFANGQVWTLKNGKPVKVK